MAMPPRPGSKAYRDQQRERLDRLGVDGRQLIEQLVGDLMRCGRRPREAWRLAYGLTQDEVATQFDQIRGDPNMRMRSSRICEYEKWPKGGVRPSVRALKILASIYGISWDRLVDVDDLERMRAGDRQAFLDISDQLYGDSLDLLLPRQRGRPSNAPRRGDGLPLNQPVAAEESATVRERLTVPATGGLPGEVTHFTGRDGPMAELRARITQLAPRTTVVTIYAIDGMAGIGKTAFARHAAQEFASRYPDGAIWVDLYGHTPGMQSRNPSGALEQILLQLGMPAEAIKGDLAERQDQWRHHIHKRRMLIVLDNARTSDQVLPLLPEAPGCLVLITSRRKLTGLTDAYPLSLDILGWDEAQRLFVKLVGDQRCEDLDAVRQILAACGRLPLAIRLIAGRLRHHRDELLADVAADLDDRTTALDALVAEHLSVRAAFECSYRLLTDERVGRSACWAGIPDPRSPRWSSSQWPPCRPRGVGSCCASWSTTICWTSSQCPAARATACTTWCASTLRNVPRLRNRRPSARRRWIALPAATWRSPVRPIGCCGPTSRAIPTRAPPGGLYWHLLTQRRRVPG
ncbi:MAG: NB-ARC domain-containing protein [Pseudonocardiaceae bacterium]